MRLDSGSVATPHVLEQPVHAERDQRRQGHAQTRDPKDAARSRQVVPPSAPERDDDPAAGAPGEHDGRDPEKCRHRNHKTRVQQLVALAEATQVDRKGKRSN